MIFLILMSACGDSRNKHEKKVTPFINDTADLYSIQQQLDSINIVLAQKDSLLGECLTCFFEIQQNLNAINGKKNLMLQASLTAQDADFKELVASSNQYVKDVGNLLKENQKKIAELRTMIQTNKMDISQLNVAIGLYEKEVFVKTNEIVQLQESLKNKNLEISSLQSMIANMNNEFHDLGSTIKQQQDLLNRAWYCVADKKTLQNSALISKNGKVLSIEASITTQVDVQQLKEIPINAKKIVILTAHPTDSYILVKKDDIVEKLIIQDIKEFWNISRYCVIQTKN